jgi:hypothetical protein
MTNLSLNAVFLFPPFSEAYRNVKGSTKFGVGVCHTEFGRFASLSLVTNGHDATYRLFFPEKRLKNEPR